LTAVRRVAEPDEIAGVALFLASDDASFTHGETLTVDGGWIVQA
jgi:NAD(P)-dependent dehydrogenase (short-subunit alcohol dehydrogenase family)